MNEKFQLPIFNDDGAGKSVRAAQSPTRRPLEEARFSRLPAINRHRTTCAVCPDGKIDPNSEFQQSTKICADCLGRFAQVSAALDTHANERARAAKLAKFGGKLRF